MVKAPIVLSRKNTTRSSFISHSKKQVAKCASQPRQQLMVPCPFVANMENWLVSLTKSGRRSEPLMTAGPDSGDPFWCWRPAIGLQETGRWSLAGLFICDGTSHHRVRLTVAFFHRWSTTCHLPCVLRPSAWPYHYE